VVASPCDVGAHGAGGHSQIGRSRLRFGRARKNASSAITPIPLHHARSLAVRTCTSFVGAVLTLDPDQHKRVSYHGAGRSS